MFSGVAKSKKRIDFDILLLGANLKNFKLENKLPKNPIESEAFWAMVRDNQNTILHHAILNHRFGGCRYSMMPAIDSFNEKRHAANEIMRKYKNIYRRYVKDMNRYRGAYSGSEDASDSDFSPDNDDRSGEDS